MIVSSVATIDNERAKDEGNSGIISLNLNVNRKSPMMGASMSDCTVESGSR